MKYPIVLIALILLAGCQRNLFEYGDAGEPKDQPEYTVQPNLNGKTAPVVEGDVQGK